MKGTEPMIPVSLPRRQGMASDEDYDTGIAQNEENLNRNLARLYSALEELRAENESLRQAVADLAPRAGKRQA